MSSLLSQVAEQKAARKEEQARRRDLILQQYKLKKAIEEAEREVSIATTSTARHVERELALSERVVKVI